MRDDNAVISVEGKEEKRRRTDDPEGRAFYEPEAAVRWPRSVWLLLVLSFARPIWAARRAHFVSYKVLGLLTVSVTTVGFFAAILLDRVIWKYTAEKGSVVGFAWNELKKLCDLLFVNMVVDLNLPGWPLWLMMLVVAASVAGLSLLLVVRLAGPGEKFLAVWGAAVKRVAMLLPCLLVLVVSISVMSGYMGRASREHWQGWSKTHPWQKPGLGERQQELHNKMAKAGALTAEKMTEFQKQIDVLSQERREYRQQREIAQQMHAAAEPLVVRYWQYVEMAMLSAVGLVPVFLLLRVGRGEEVGAMSKWPAQCEGCGYQIFPVKQGMNEVVSVKGVVEAARGKDGALTNRDAEHGSGGDGWGKRCAECGREVEESIPPVHRVDPIFCEASWRWPVQLVSLYVKTSLMVMRSPWRFAHELRASDPSLHHHRFMFVVMLHGLLISLVAVNGLFLIDTFYLRAHSYTDYHSIAGINHAVFNYERFFSELFELNVITGVFTPMVVYGFYLMVGMLFAITFRVFGRQHMAYVAGKVSAYMMGALMWMTMPVVVVVMWVLVESSKPILTNFFRVNLQIGALRIEEELVAMMTCGVFVMPVMLYFLYLNYRVMRLVRYANA
ncbi:hypothetical protein [Poriferisphaera sp. WC338]|uniref:hypothetical protein n=1 Tax=Poriferisphaera sp. WC338 TaxID=3425129 RepID=UPI003D814953